jgi:membrane-bound inhibitor of C-type lysozyme
MKKQLLILLVTLSITGCEQPIEKASYTCDPNVTINTLITEHTLTLLINGQSYPLARERSASGEKFKNKHILFWRKGKESMLIKSGIKYHCKQV